MSEFHHVSVLLEECIEGLNIKPEGIYVDGTLGGAGHSSRIAALLTTGRHIGIDRDPIALKAAAQRLEPWKDRVTLVHSNFCEIAQESEIHSAIRHDFRSVTRAARHEISTGKGHHDRDCSGTVRC